MHICAALFLQKSDRPRSIGKVKPSFTSVARSLDQCRVTLFSSIASMVE